MSASETQMLPPQVQDRQPGLETEMEPRPAFAPLHPGSDPLKGKVALVYRRRQWHRPRRRCSVCP